MTSAEPTTTGTTKKPMEWERLDFANAFGIEVRNLRLERKWTQAEAARALGIARGNYSRVERGMHSPRPEAFLRAAEVFGYDEGVLFKRVVLRARVLAKKAEPCEL